jgi:cupin superfamily protein
MVLMNVTPREAAAVRPAPGLAAFIDPVDVAEFVSRYWERELLLVRRDDPEFYSHLLTMQDVDHILAHSGLRESELRVIVGGENVWPREIGAETGSRAAGDLARVYDLYQQGGTINLTYLHERWEPLIRLCRRMTIEFSAEVKSNVYLTPAGVQGLKPHHDTHDVFVAQIYGTKHWRLFESPITMPLHGQRYQHPPEGPGEPIREFDLTPGDMLYLPRGIVHDATSAGAASLHLTIGVIPLRWAEVIRSVVKKVTAENLCFRASVPTPLTVGDWRTAADLTGAQMIAALAELISPADLIAEMGSSGPHGFKPVMDGHLLDTELIDSIDLDTPVKRRPDTQWWLSAGESELRLEYHGKSLLLPAHVIKDARFAAEAGMFRGRDLPGDLDEPGRLVLIRLLVREGFLTIAAEEGNGSAPHPA